VCGLTAHRGFESRPVRQIASKDAPFGAFFVSTIKSTINLVAV